MLVTTDETYLKAEKLDAKIIRGSRADAAGRSAPTATARQVRTKAAPIEYAREKLPPFLILYADKDMVGCDKPVAEAFRKGWPARRSAETVEIKGSNHIDIIARAGTAGSDVQKAIAKFVVERTK